MCEILSDETVSRWRLFAFATRPWRLGEDMLPLAIIYAIALFSMIAALSNIASPVGVGILAASLTMFLVALLYALALAGNYRLARWFRTIGRRSLTPDELLEIVKWAPTSEMRDKVREVVAAHPAVRIRNMLALHVEAAQMARRLEAESRDLEIAKARKFILESNG